jgi:hypothetical protein
MHRGTLSTYTKNAPDREPAVERPPAGLGSKVNHDVRLEFSCEHRAGSGSVYGDRSQDVIIRDHDAIADGPRRALVTKA